MFLRLFKSVFRIAHYSSGHSSLCSKKGYNVKSYGTGSVIKLPGPGPNLPNVYEFGTTYEQIYQDLMAKDPQLYPLIRSCQKGGVALKKPNSGCRKSVTDIWRIVCTQNKISVCMLFFLRCWKMDLIVMSTQN